MIFTGDVALPYSKAIKFDFPEFFGNQKWVINLEGALVSDSSPYLKSNLVVNQLDAIEDITSNRNVAFALNNNHILDNNSFEETLKNLQSLKKDYFGAGANLEEASKPFCLKEKGKDFVFLSYGWSIVECPIAGKNKAGLLPLSAKRILKDFKISKFKNPDKKILVLVHWDYELEEFPMPAHRNLSKQLIDAGCEAIIGAHPHRVQGIEVYKGKPIVYSLGNWMFKQGVYRDGKLNFPDFCNLQLAFEYDLDGNHKCHFFNYNKKNQSVDFLESEALNISDKVQKLTPFAGLSNKDYLEWFKKNRYHKKFIPIYTGNESTLGVLGKNSWNRLRTIIINYMVKLKFKN